MSVVPNEHQRQQPVVLVVQATKGVGDVDALVNVAPERGVLPDPVILGAGVREVGGEPATPTPEPVRFAPPPTAAPVDETWIDGFEAVICGYDWTPYTCGQIVGVAACESGRDVMGRLDGNWATSGVSYGLFQLAPSFHDWPDFWDGEPPNWADAEWNTMKAHSLFLAQGLSPWSCAYAAGVEP